MREQTPPSDRQTPELPPLDAEMRFILGKPCFECAPIAHRLKALGLVEVKPKAEDEQAVAIHWMLSLYLEHGEKWRYEANQILSTKTTGDAP